MGILSSALVLSSAARAGTVYVSPGDSLQYLVNQYPAGTTFQLSAGVYRFQSVVPKSYDQFIGEAGVVLSGAARLTSFSQSGSYWVAKVSVSPKTADPSMCDSAHPGCTLREDLFFDSVPRRRVLSLSQVGAGRWYLDYNTGNVYMGDNPSGHVVEISLTRSAFSGSATGVVISLLTIEKYASGMDEGAIHGRKGTGTPSQHWTVKWNDIRLNHGMGLRIGDYMWVHHNKIYKNGQLGMGGTGKSVVVQSNEVWLNNLAGFAWNRAGGTKFVKCYNLKVQYNYVHHNNGPGLWTDIENDYVLYEHNHTTRNVIAGIFHEISYHATIRYNYIESDGADPRGSNLWWGAGILINTSSNVAVYGNTVKDCLNGIGGVQAYRGTGSNGLPYLLQNLSVHDNSIAQVTGTAAGIVRSWPLDNTVYSDWNNHFQNNTFNLTYSGYKYFYWLAEYWTLSQWDTYASLH
ncbi:MAG: right-handed parallel beta-helix repeat-containing protein [Terriglobia bacterium]